jgi:hypothetical protein
MRVSNNIANLFRHHSGISKRRLYDCSSDWLPSQRQNHHGLFVPDVVMNSVKRQYYNPIRINLCSSNIKLYSWNSNDNVIKRYVSSNWDEQIIRALKKEVGKDALKIDDDGRIEPCMENGFGYVVARKPRLGYEDGLYGVNTFGCSYDRHGDDPTDDYLDFFEIEILIEQRVDCKLVQDFDMADTIQEELQVLHGVYLDDEERIWTTRPEAVSTRVINKFKQDKDTKK